MMCVGMCAQVHVQCVCVCVCVRACVCVSSYTPFHTNGLMMVAASFNRLDSPTIIGPPSAINLALGWTTVLAPMYTQEIIHTKRGI